MRTAAPRGPPPPVLVGAIGFRPVSFQNDSDFGRTIDLSIDRPAGVGGCVDPREIRPETPTDLLCASRTSWSQQWSPASWSPVPPGSPTTPRSPLSGFAPSFAPVTPDPGPKRLERGVDGRPGARSNLDLWLERRGLGKYSAAIADLGARKVSDLSYLEQDDLIKIGMEDYERADVQVVVG